MVSNLSYYADGSDQDSLARTFGDGGYSSGKALLKAAHEKTT